MYTMVNETYRYGRDDVLLDRGLSVYGYCSLYSCYLLIVVNPTDLRYNEAQITGVLNLPECFDSSNITDPITLNIQGTLFTGTKSIPCVLL